jgi:Fe2+ or Zn2+ uptake regulation protein
MQNNAKLRLQIIQALKDRGGRITQQRLGIIDALLTFHEPLTANRILEQVSKVEGEIGMDTVYRNLKTLVELGIINQIVDSGKKGSRFELTEEHHHHIVCTSCGVTECLHHCPVDEKRLLDEVNKTGFLLSSHRLELFGLCGNCRIAKSKKI